MKAEYQEITIDALPKPLGEYSNGIVIPLENKRLILLTGQVATDKDGRVVCSGDAKGQIEYIFENIKLLLAEAGAGLEDIIKVSIFLTDMSDFDSISPVRDKYLRDSRPVSTLLEINKTAVEGCRVEVVVTALK